MSGRWATALDLGAAAIMAITLAIALHTVDDYGVTWDEDWHLNYGDYILEWFLTLGHDRSALCYKLDFLYGGAYDLLGAVLRRISPLSDVETIHRLGVFMSITGVAGAWRLARRLCGPVGGFLAVLLLVTTPVYYGHMFNNPKDVPFATGYIWALDSLCAVVMCMPRVPRRLWIRFAVLAGLTMGVRIGGLLLLVYLGAAVVVLAYLRARATGSLDAGIATLRRLGRPAAMAMTGAWVVMILPWPWALLDPIRRPLMSLGRMSHFTAHKRTMPFAGEEMLTTEPRWDYLPHYFTFKLPVLELLLIALAVGLTVHALWRHRRRIGLVERNLGLTLTAAILAPPIYAIVLRSVLYDGLRHFLFLVPPLAVVSAVGVVVAARRLNERLRPRALLAVAVVSSLGATTLLVRQVQTMRELHPNQYTYFNELIGGLPGAFGNYDTDYYGNSYREGFATLEAWLWEHDRENFLQSRYRVNGCIPDFIARHYLDGNFSWAKNTKQGAQFYLGYTRADCHLRYKSQPEIFTVGRQDTMLLIGRDLRGAREDADDEAQGPEDARTRPRKREATIGISGRKTNRRRAPRTPKSDGTPKDEPKGAPAQ